IQRTLLDHSKNERVCGFEYERILDTLSNEIVDREETPIIDLFVYVLPVRQQVVLLREYRFERRKAGWIFGLALYPGEIVCDEIVDLRVLRHELTQPLSQRFEALPAIGAGVSGGSGLVGECPGSRGDAGIFLKRGGLIAKRFAEFVQPPAEN